MSNLKSRIKALVERVRHTARPKPGVVRVCLTKAEEDAARKEFESLPKDIVRIICTAQDMSGPRPKRPGEKQK